MFGDSNHFPARFLGYILALVEGQAPDAEKEFWITITIAIENLSIERSGNTAVQRISRLDQNSQGMKTAEFRRYISGQTVIR